MTYHTENPTSLATQNPLLLIGFGILIGLILFWGAGRLSQDGSPTKTSLSPEDRILGKWEMISDSSLLNRELGSEFEFIKGGNVNSHMGVLQYSFPDPQHLKLADGNAAAIVTFSFDKENIILQQEGQSPIILAPFAPMDVTQDDLVGIWSIYRRIGHEEPCIDVRSEDTYNEMVFGMIGPRSIAFEKDGTVSIWLRQTLLVNEKTYSIPSAVGTYFLEPSKLTINSPGDGLYQPVNTMCMVQKTNTKLIFNSPNTGAVLHLVHAEKP